MCIYIQYIHPCMHACMHACMHVCMYVRTYVRMYVCMYVIINILVSNNKHFLFCNCWTWYGIDYIRSYSVYFGTMCKTHTVDKSCTILNGPLLSRQETPNKKTKRCQVRFCKFPEDFCGGTPIYPFFSVNFPLPSSYWGSLILKSSNHTISIY